MATRSLTHGTTPALVFQSTTFTPIKHNNQVWLRAGELARALDYTDEKSVHRIYSRHSDEFTSAMTGVVKLTTPSGKQDTRIFSLRGAHFVAMFARTPIAKDFRRWVLDVLDAQVGSPVIEADSPDLESHAAITLSPEMQGIAIGLAGKVMDVAAQSILKHLLSAAAARPQQWLFTLQWPSATHAATVQFAPVEGFARGDTLNETIDRLTNQIKEPGGYPAHLFLPLVNAVLARTGFTFELPRKQQTEILKRLTALANRSDRPGHFEEVVSLARVLRGQHPGDGTDYPPFRQIIERHNSYRSAEL